MKIIIKIFACSLGAVLVLSLAVILPTHLAAAQSVAPTYRYTHVAQSDSTSSLVVYDLATDSVGNTFTTGNFAGTVNFNDTGNDSFTSMDYGVAANSGYLTKRHADGSYAWTKTTALGPNGGYVQPNKVAVDASGNIYEFGDFQGDVIFDGVNGTHEVDAGNSVSGIYLTKYNAVGTYQWTHTTTVLQASQAINAAGLVIDSGGNIFMATMFSGTLNFGSLGGISDSKTAAGSYNNDEALTRLDSSGNYGWTRVFDTSNGSIDTTDLAIDSSGDVYSTGYLSGTVDFGGSNHTISDSSGGNGSFFIAASEAGDGSVKWVHGISGDNDGSSGVFSQSIAADPSGNVYVTGYLLGSANFNSAGGTDHQSSNDSNSTTFTTKYTKSGAYGWTRAFNGTGSSSDSGGLVITTDALGNVYVLSTISGQINFAYPYGNDTVNQHMSGALTRYGSDGSYAWTKVFDTTSGGTVDPLNYSVSGLATDTLGNVYAASTYQGTVGFDGPGGSDQRSSSGYFDAFLTSYRSFDPVGSTAITAPTTSSSSTMRYQAFNPNNLTTTMTPTVSSSSTTQTNNVTVATGNALTAQAATINRLIPKTRHSIPNQSTTDFVGLIVGGLTVASCCWLYFRRTARRR